MQMKKIRLLMEFKEGKLEFDRAYFNDKCSSLEDGKYMFEITKYRKKRTLLQNALYWTAIVKKASEVTKVSMSDVHAFHKSEFLSESVYIEGLNKTITKVRSTTDLNTKEFGYFLDRLYEYYLDNYGVDMKQTEKLFMENYDEQEYMLKYT